MEEDSAALLNRLVDKVGEAFEVKRISSEGNGLTMMEVLDLCLCFFDEQTKRMKKSA